MDPFHIAFAGKGHDNVFTGNEVFIKDLGFRVQDLRAAGSAYCSFTCWSSSMMMFRIFSSDARIPSSFSDLGLHFPEFL